MSRITIEHVRGEALKRGCKCLSNQYISLNTVMEWECDKMHHIWSATFKSFRGKGTSTNSRCPICIPPKSKVSMVDVHNIAAEKEGKCLSTEYKNSYTPLLWECRKFHDPWWATFSSIKYADGWCPKCVRENMSHTIEFVKQTALERGGECLSETYTNNKAKLIWKCHNSQHVPFEMALHDVLGNHWCPRCGYDSYMCNIEDAHEAAAKHHGKCLSENYEGSMKPLIWQCKKMHPPWTTTLNSVRNHNSWCPTCHESKGEKIIAELLGNLGQRQYPVNNFDPSIKSNMRYDFIVPSTKWIVENDGVQHFTDVPYFTKMASLEHRHELDCIKTELALKSGYSILRIHYYDLPHIQSILPIVFEQPPNPILCISREDEYNYLNIKGKYTVHVTKKNTFPATDSIASSNVNKLLNDVHRMEPQNSGQLLTLNINQPLTLNINQPLTLNINQPLTLNINRQ